MLVGGHHPKIVSFGRRGAASAPPRREHRDPLIRLALQARNDPARRAATRPRPPPARRPLGLRPGWASIDGGNDEFPLFRDTSRSSRSTFA